MYNFDTHLLESMNDIIYKTDLKESTEYSTKSSIIKLNNVISHIKNISEILSKRLLLLERRGRAFRVYHFLCVDEISLEPTTTQEFYYALVSSAVSYKIPKSIIHKVAIKEQVSRFGSSIMKYIRDPETKDHVDSEVIEAAVLQDPRMIKCCVTVTEKLAAVALINLPETFDEVMELPVDFLKSVVLNVKFDDYSFLKHFPINFTLDLVTENPELYHIFPEFLKYDDRVIAKLLSRVLVDKLTFNKTVDMKLYFDLLDHCSHIQRKKISKTVRKIWLL